MSSCFIDSNKVFFIYKNDLYNFVRHFKKEGVGNASYACFGKGNMFEVG